jgi:multidrug efflux pump subunit AcrA (membrane-fusion protein)
VNRSLLFGVVIGVVASGLVYLRFGIHTQTVRVDRGPVGERIVARAAVVATSGPVHVYARSAGRVARVFARAGDQVRAGDALAEVESAGRSESLTAPVAGVILADSIDVGDYARPVEQGQGIDQPRQPLFVLADPTRTELRIEVEEADAVRLASGQDVAVRALGSTRATAQGRIVRVSAQLEPRSIGVQDARVRAGGLVRAAYASWGGDPLGWPLGTRAEALVDLGRREAAARLPRDAVTVREGRTVVERPNAFGLWSHETSIDVVRVDAAFAEIRGLAVGSEVIVPES